MSKSRMSRSNWKVIVLNINGHQTNFYLNEYGGLLNPIKKQKSRSVKSALMNKNSILPPHPFSTAIISDSNRPPGLLNNIDDLKKKNTECYTQVNTNSFSKFPHGDIQIQENLTLQVDKSYDDFLSPNITKPEEITDPNNFKTSLDNHLSENTVNDNSKNDSKSNVSSRIMNSLINIIFSTQDTKDLSDKDIESDYSDYDSSNVDLCTH